MANTIITSVSLLESIVVVPKLNGPGIDIAKCFTYFSALKAAWLKYRRFNEKIFVNLQFKNQLYQDNKLSILLHSANEMADYLTASTFKTSQAINIKFTRIKSSRLGKGYETNCYLYNLANKYANFNMESDCLIDCRRRLLTKYQACLDDLTYTFIRQGFFWNGSHEKLLPCSFKQNEDIYYNLTFECMKCLPE